MKILTVIGARPQFIKAAVVSRAFASAGKVKEVIIHTGQHFDNNMSDIFFEEMNIPKPYKNLHIHGLGHGAMTGQMLAKIETVLIEEKPDWMLVYGDTNSTIAGALAAKKLHIKVAHIEAGLRSFNMRMPEEINRILTDRISDLLFCPTDTAVQNLNMEGYKNIQAKIVKSGDVMQDAAFFYALKAVKPTFNILNNFILATVHRAENTDSIIDITNIFKSLEIIAKDIQVILPLHPRTKAKLETIGYDFDTSKITFVTPVGYLEMIYLLKNCNLVMTDSGGLQKEAYFFQKNCITLREETEWVELVEHGFNVLVGSNIQKILASVAQMSSRKNNFNIPLYGNGNAAEIILEELMNF
jgi:UDP-GlcNAc3NAcA epimerase